MDILIAVLATLAFSLIVAFFVTNLRFSEKRIQYKLEVAYGVEDDQFLRSMGNLLGPTFVGGNRLKSLLNGDQIFPEMLAAVHSAKRSITFETYIYWSGVMGQKFADALSERARAGVSVHVVLDGLGAVTMDSSYLRQMRDAGCQVEWYNPVRWYSLSRLNYRTHRKLLVIDGRIGFTGGVGIADQWMGNGESPDHWRDSHFRIEGPAVSQMQAAFMDNWIKTHSDVLHDHRYFPPLEAVGRSLVQVFKSSPREGSESVRLMYLLAIAAARQSMRLGIAYFVPDDLAVKQLLAARKRGVTVEIIVPGKLTDVRLVRRASRALWGPLLEAGCEIYEFQPTMYHCKVMIVDGLLVSVGSTNFDDRSFRLNDEVNMNVLDADFAAEQLAFFERDKTSSRQMTFDEWKRRPWSEKAKEWIASRFRTQL